MLLLYVLKTKKVICRRYKIMSPFPSLLRSQSHNPAVLRSELALTNAEIAEEWLDPQPCDLNTQPCRGSFHCTLQCNYIHSDQSTVGVSEPVKPQRPRSLDSAKGPLYFLAA